MVSRGKAIGLWVGLVLLTGRWGGVAYGVPTFGFTSISASSSADATIGENQFFLEVLSQTSSQTTFQIRNTGPTAASIVAIFIENGHSAGVPPFVSLASTTATGPGVSFMTPAVPPTLTGATTVSPAFQVAPPFVLTANMPVLQNGINPGEALDVTVNRADDMTTGLLLSGLESGTLRVAVEAQGFPDNGTATFVNTTTAVSATASIPAPAALLLGALGAGVVGWLRRRRTLA